MVLSCAALLAQAPSKFSYQAVVRNSSGLVVPSGTSVAFRFTIRDGSAGGAVLFQETQIKTTNNAFGLVNLEIGAGTVQQGAYPTANQWASGAKFLQVEVDPAGGVSYSDMGATQLLAVPYANYANAAGSANNLSGTVQPSQITAGGASSGQVLQYNGSNWVPVTLDGDISEVVAGTGLSGGGTSGTVTINALTTTALWNANAIQGTAVGTTAPTSGQTLKYNGSSWTPAADDNTTYTAGTGLSLSGTTFNSVWTTSGTSIFNNNSGNVGIGTSTPASNTKLYVKGTGSNFFEDFLVEGSSSINGMALKPTNASSITGIKFAQSTGSSFNASILFAESGAYAGNFVISADNSANTTDFTINKSTKNIGIGTVNAAYKLDVIHPSFTGVRVKSKDTSSFLDIDAEKGFAGIRYLRKGTHQWTAGSRYADDYFEISEAGGGGSRFVIQDGTGNVGIGETTSPSYKLDVLHGGSTGIRVKSSSSFSVLDIDAASGDAAIRFAKAGVNQWNLRNRPADDDFELFELGGGGSRLIIQNGTGYMGLNKNIPTFRLHVGGNLRADSNIYAGMKMGVGTNTPSSTLQVTASNSTSFSMPSPFSFGSFNGASVTQVGAGGSTTCGLIAGSAYSSALYNLGLCGLASGGTAGYGVYGSSASAGTNYGVFCNGNGTYTGTWSSSSDRKLKKDIAPINNGLSLIMQLKPTSYLFRTDDPEYKAMNLATGLHFGFIAQELEEVIPAVVTNNVHPGDQGTSQGPINFKGVNYTELIPILTQAIQEQQAQIESLKKEVEALKAANK